MTASPINCEYISLSSGGSQVALVTLNRTSSLNAIDWTMIRRLDEVLDELLEDGTVRALLITGAGRAFSAGGDLKKYIELQQNPVDFPRFVDDLHRVFSRLRGLPFPAIALVNGVTAAGGLELLLNCDFALAAASAKIGDGHLNFGQMGGGGVLTLLPRIVGLPKAVELLLTGRFLSAHEAEDWGLVSRVVADEDLLEAGMQIARDIASKSALGVRNAKEVMNGIWSDNLPLASRLERKSKKYYQSFLTSEDASEGLAAFSEKRPPHYQGR